MIPRTVTDEDVASFSDSNPEAVKRTFIGADDSPNVDPCEAVVHRSSDGVTAVMRVPLNLEPGEMTKLLAGGTVWLTMWGGVAPFAVEVVGTDERMGHAEKALQQREQEAYDRTGPTAQVLQIVRHKLEA